MRVVFLDFDGVINSEQYISSERPFRDIALAPGLRPEHAHYLARFDPLAAELIAKFVTRNELRVVISSNWREAFGWRVCSEFLNSLAKFPQGAVIDETPSYTPTAKRGLDISAWLLKNTYVSNYVIFDDLEPINFLPEQRCALVQTDPAVGITEADLRKAEEILNRRFS